MELFGNQSHSIWTEKYRPSTLENYIGNEHIVEKVKIYLKNNDIPHLLFYGSAGTGKTTIAKIITNSIECDVMYINASDENSVDTVRTKIKNFASTAGFKPLKVIICDEFDFMTANGQAALRNLMETFSKTTRFILTCNYIEKVIDPIQSRCQTFAVNPPSRKDVCIHAADILRKENIEFNPEDILTIVNVCYPDIRKVINSCQKQVLDGKLIIDKQSLVESNYMTKVLEILKLKIDKNKKLVDIRQLIADSQVRSFEPFYRFLFDNIDEFAKGNESSAILIIAEYCYFDSLVVDKEINCMAMLIKLVREL